MEQFKILLVEDDAEISGMDVMQHIRKSSFIQVIILSQRYGIG